MSEQHVVVMGLGNLLWADEGFGVRVAERLYAHYHWPEYVEIVDGGTQGLNLLGYVESASHLLILDIDARRTTLETAAPENAFRLISARRK
ncbi:Hydrogenase 2 maturation endopeptidase [Escherichia coli]|nr:Hydrogenase 2 maturation endopeptidase [Escherichia coli]